MKEIEYYIESNKKILEEKKEELSKTSRKEEDKIKRLRTWITELEGYIMGLEDAKKYIENEKNNNNK